MIERNYIDQIHPWLGKQKIIILKGARQVGKTSLMKEIEKKLIEKNQKTVFLYADKIDDQNIFESPSNFINYLKYNFNLEKDFLYVFIDEFQFINNSGLFLKNIFDEYKENLQIIVSGSSSLEISKNSEFLTGRSINFYIDRISFKESFLYKEKINNFKNFNISDEKSINDFYQTFLKKIEENFLLYLTYGGYPEIITTVNLKEKEIILSQIIETYISKDIIHFLKIENITAFNNLIKLLSSNIGNLVNINEISNVLNISMQTVNKYIEILEQTFVFKRINPYFQNTRKEISKMPKIFVQDIGIKNYSLKEFDSTSKKIDLGKEVENFIFNELSKKFENIYYYRTISKAEIDFVIEKSYQNFLLFEVKYTNKKTKSPIVMNNFESNYKVEKKLIITKNYIGFEDEVIYIPACILAFIDF